MRISTQTSQVQSMIDQKQPEEFGMVKLIG